MAKINRVDLQRVLNLAERGVTRMSPGERQSLNRVKEFAREQEKPPARPRQAKPPAGDEVLALGLSGNVPSVLIDAEYDTLEKLRAASDEELLRLHGIGERAVEQIRERVGA